MTERKLPMAGNGSGGTREEPRSGTDGPAPAPPPARPRASSARLVSTLATAGAVAGLVIVLVFQWSEPRIQAHQARVLRAAVQEVLGAPDETRTFFLVDGRFTESPGAGVDTASVDRVYVGFDEAGGAVGVAMAAAEPGFQDVIRLIFGYDPDRGQVLGMKVLESKETPGLGDKIEKDSTFVGEFRGVEAPLEGVKDSRSTGAPDEVVMITGATISSRAVIDIINHRLDALEQPLGALWRDAIPATRTGAAGVGGAPPPSPAGGTP